MPIGDWADLVVFDFDGTLCDSADVKTEVFHFLYLDEMGERFADAVRAYHLEHAGVSRFDKIAYIEETMIGRPCDAARLQQVADRFGSIVEDRVVAAPLLPGVRAFLDDHRGDVRMLVASATPTEELRRIVDRKGLRDVFSDIEGSPRSKGEILSGYVVGYGVPAERVVMVGDQHSDLRAAVEAGTPFVGVRPAGLPRLFDEETTVIVDFSELEPAIHRAVTAWSAIA